MTIYYVAEVERPEDRILAYHEVPLKGPSDKGFYNEVRSWSAFSNPFHPERRQNRHRWYFVRSQDDYEIHVSVWENTCRRAGVTYMPVPVIVQASVDEFYDHIGYDRKHKRLK